MFLFILETNSDNIHWETIRKIESLRPNYDLDNSLHNQYK